MTPFLTVSSLHHSVVDQEIVSTSAIFRNVLGRSVTRNRVFRLDIEWVHVDG